MTNEMQTKTEMLYNQAVSSIKQGNFPHGVLIECQNSNVGEEFARFIANALVCTGDNKPCSVCSESVLGGCPHPPFCCPGGQTVV